MASFFSPWTEEAATCTVSASASRWMGSSITETLANQKSAPRTAVIFHASFSMG